MLDFCGARRDEEKSRAKERVIRSGATSDNGSQEPADRSWGLYNSRIERVSQSCFSAVETDRNRNLAYTSGDHPVVPLYFAKEREVGAAAMR